LWKNSITMFRLLFWGFIGYIVYRYFQMKAQIKEGPNRHFAQHQPQGGTPPEQTRKTAAPEKNQSEGEFIDYEEIK
jgi:hypothetical protein